MRLLYWRSNFHAPLIHHAISGRIINSFIPEAYKKNYFKIENTENLNLQGPPEDLFIAETGRVYFTNRIQNKNNYEILIPSLSPDFSPKPRSNALDYDKLDSIYSDLEKHKINFIIYFYLSYLGRLPEVSVIESFLLRKSFNLQTLLNIRKDMIDSNEYKSYLKESSIIPGSDLRFFLGEKTSINRAVKLFSERYFQ